MKTARSCFAVALALSSVCAGTAWAGPFLVERVATGLDQPLYATGAPGDSEHLFIVEQRTGEIKVLNLASRTVLAAPLLDIDDAQLTSGGEEGLLGLAFHPDFANNGKFYVNYTSPRPGGSQTKIVEYTTQAGKPLEADPASARMIMSFDQPFANHNGGWMGFNPVIHPGQAQHLYIATGDGGSGNDPNNNAQDITDNPLGKILRVNPDGDDFADPNRNYSIPSDNPFVGTAGDEEIWAYGLRNPWRPSFDRLKGDFYIADVGQNTREEVNFQPASSTGGENYGWRLREGTIATPTPPSNPVGGPKPPGAVDPIYDYAHGNNDEEGESVTGGYVYRGPVPELQDQYFFADFINQRIWSFHYDGSTLTDFTDWTNDLVSDVGSIGAVASFGEDAMGNLYIVDYGGEVFMLAPVPSPATAALLMAGSVCMLHRRSHRRNR